MRNLFLSLKRKTADERGTVSSWLILLAGLAAAAGIASAIVSATITELATEVGSGTARIPVASAGPARADPGPPGDRTAGTDADTGRTGNGDTDTGRTGNGDTGNDRGTDGGRATDNDRSTDGGRTSPDDADPPPPTVDSSTGISANGVDFTVGTYQDPAIAHDNGFLQNPNDPNDPNPIPTRPPTQDEIDYYESERSNATWGNRTGWLPLGWVRDEFNWDNAVDAYLHFLTGNGADRTFDMDSYLSDDANGQILERSLLEDARLATNQAIENLDAEGQLPDSGSVTFTITSDPVTTRIGDPVYPYPDSTNWQRTVGGMPVWTTSEVTATRLPDGSIEVTTTTTIHGEDRYNFNRGQAAIDSGEPDSLRGVLEESGLAHQYTQRGSTTRSVTWVVPNQ